jgi:glycosyltransferase involved in cell wall biosynthesis
VTPAVSIGLPFRDARGTIEATVRSVFAQTLQAWELILVDDGSTDGAVERLREVSDARVRIVADGQQRGLCARLNEIADAARAPLLARLDADDLMHPERLARQAAWLAAHLDVDVLGSAAWVVDARTQLVGLRAMRPLSDVPRRVLRPGFLCHPSVTARTAWFRRHRYDPAFVRTEDHELWCRAAATTRFAKLDEPLLYYREHAAPRVDAYVRAMRGGLEVYRRHGPALAGRARTALYGADHRLRIAAYVIAARLGLLGPWRRARNARLPAALAARGTAGLAAIAAAHVPGWDAAAAPRRAAER